MKRATRHLRCNEKRVFCWVTSVREKLQQWSWHWWVSPSPPQAIHLYLLHPPPHVSPPSPPPIALPLHNNPPALSIHQNRNPLLDSRCEAARRQASQANVLSQRSSHSVKSRKKPVNATSVNQAQRQRRRGLQTGKTLFLTLFLSVWNQGYIPNKHATAPHVRSARVCFCW